MTKTPEAPENENNAGDMRGKLIKRLAVAGVLVASLLGMLAFFDYLSTTPPEEPEAPVFTRPVPVAPKKEVSQPVTQATDLPEPPTPITAEPVLEAPPAPVIEAEAPPPLAAEPAPHAEKRPIRPLTATMRPPSAVAPRAPAPSLAPVRPAPPAVPEATAAPSIAIEAPPAVAKSAKPSARVIESTPSPAMPTPQRLFAGFLLQAGVFTSPERAEELHAKLTLSGIQSSLETRVQIGPFRTRQEAEKAQVKLRELGIESVLVPLKGAKH